MQQANFMDDAPENREPEYNSWDASEPEESVNSNQAADQKKKNTSPAQKKSTKNSAAKAVSHARSAVGNTNPNVRTGLSDDLNTTGTNVAYTERED